MTPPYFLCETRIMTSVRAYPILTGFDRGCTKCQLSNKAAIAGHSFCGNNQVEMLIVGAYPAREEMKQGFSFAPNIKRERKDVMNAGRFLRASINSIFTGPEIPSNMQPFYRYTAFSNMIKCSPLGKAQKIPITPKHIAACSKWLEKEIETLSHFNINMPIMLCGSEAVQLLGKHMKVFSKRREVYLYKNRNPVVISFNPVEVVRYTPFAISQSKTTGAGRLVVEDTAVKSPIVFGSPNWHWNNDLTLLKSLVVKNLQYRNSLPVNYTLEDLYRRFANDKSGK